MHSKQWEEFLRLDTIQRQQHQALQTAYTRPAYPDYDQRNMQYVGNTGLSMDTRNRYPYPNENYSAPRPHDAYSDYQNQRHEDYGKTYGQYQLWFWDQLVSLLLPIFSNLNCRNLYRLVLLPIQIQLSKLEKRVAFGGRYAGSATQMVAVLMGRSFCFSPFFCCLHLYLKQIAQIFRVPKWGFKVIQRMPFPW